MSDAHRPRSARSLLTGVTRSLAARVLVASACLLIVGTGPTLAGTWTTSRLTSGDDRGPAIAFDRNGRIHVSFIRWSGTTGVYYRTNASGTWVTKWLAPLSTSRSERWTDIAVDPDGKVHVVYHRMNDGVYYLTDRSGSWVRTKLRSTGMLEVFPSLAVGGTGKAHVAFFVTGTYRGIHYLTNRSGRWVSSRATTNGNDREVDIALDRYAKAHLLVSRDYDGYWYVTNRTGSWTSRRLKPATFPTHAGIRVDGSGRAYAAFSVGDGSAQGLWYAATDSSGSWASQRLDGYVRGNVSLVRTNLGKIHIVFDRPNPIHYTNESSGGWSSQAITFDAQSEAGHALAFHATAGLRVVYGRTDSSLGIAARAP